MNPGWGQFCMTQRGQFRMAFDSLNRYALGSDPVRLKRATRLLHFRSTSPAREASDWRDVSRIVLHIDPDHEAERACRAFDSHLSRAKWVSRVGYRQLLREV